MIKKQQEELKILLDDKISGLRDSSDTNKVRRRILALQTEVIKEIIKKFQYLADRANNEQITIPPQLLQDFIDNIKY
jgi:hypothetical protein